jgi:hypothetical protein
MAAYTSQNRIPAATKDSIFLFLFFIFIGHRKRIDENKLMPESMATLDVY